MFATKNNKNKVRNMQNNEKLWNIAGLSHVEKVILTALIVHSQNSEIQISNKELARISTASIRCVQSTLNHLHDLNLIEKKECFSDSEYFKKTQLANHYTIMVDINELFYKGL